jgi:hypothetical protein
LNTRARRLALLTFIISLPALALPDVGFAQTKPLKILLTNDDGFDSTGLKVMQSALVAAGHQVTVVAPATNMSSSGMSMTSGVLTRMSSSAWGILSSSRPRLQFDHFIDLWVRLHIQGIPEVCGIVPKLIARAARLEAPAAS